MSLNSWTPSRNIFLVGNLTWNQQILIHLWKFDLPSRSRGRRSVRLYSFLGRFAPTSPSHHITRLWKTFFLSSFLRLTQVFLLWSIFRPSVRAQISVHLEFLLLCRLFDLCQTPIKGPSLLSCLFARCLLDTFSDIFLTFSFCFVAFFRRHTRGWNLLRGLQLQVLFFGHQVA